MLRFLMLSRIARGEDIDDLIDCYITAYIDECLENVLRQRIPGHKLGFYDLLNYIMELQDITAVLKGKEIEADSIVAYMLTLVVP